QCAGFHAATRKQSSFFVLQPASHHVESFPAPQPSWLLAGLEVGRDETNPANLLLWSWAEENGGSQPHVGPVGLERLHISLLSKQKWL
ncbi:hypothetical protein, partial [Streptococcus suis]|uniref:hypothetical protein n=1 Tax=Streptococcus suis TaxID=1307 RepID=UPI003CEFAECC